MIGKKSLLYGLLLAVALSAGSCRRAAEKVGREVRFEGIERVERQGLTGAEIVVRVDNASGYRLALASAEIGIYYGEARVGTIVLCDPVEIERRTTASVPTLWRLRISDPLALYVMVRKVKAGEYGGVFVSCALEGRGGPVPVKFSREKMPLSDFLNIFGLSIRDIENFLK